MTIFGPDVSSYQTGLDLSTVPDLSFVIAKTSEGTYYTDPAYQGFRNQVSRLGKPFIWYHLVSGEPADAQVEHTLRCVGEPTLPGMIDCERSSGPGPTWAQILAYADAAASAGLNLRLVYLPHWYWQAIGSPDITPLTQRRLHLVSSDYIATGAYAGDTGLGWNAYGGVTPELWQYTDNHPAGYSLAAGLDFNAYRGTPAQLEALLAPTQGEDVAITFASGQVNTGPDAKTLICPPPANTGANWGNVWISFGSDLGDATLRIAGYVHGEGWKIFPTVTVPAAGDRVNPFGGPAPAGLQKISVVRQAGSENVPVGWLIEAAGR